MAKKNEKIQSIEQQRRTLHKNLNFTASEAYKLLRTNIMFALPSEGSRCRIIGVTSSIRGEGKSTTSINLSYTLAEMGKRVLLIDGDMRLPSVASKMEMPGTPGLSNILVSPSGDLGMFVKSSGVNENWRIITAGDLPPNPSELLASKQMQVVLRVLATKFDFIIVDLPPVNIVSDALVLSPVLDGIIVVVRENYTERKELRSCIRSLTLADAKILGIQMNDVKEEHKRYGRYGKYGKYYKYYQSDTDAE